MECGELCISNGQTIIKGINNESLVKVTGFSKIPNPHSVGVMPGIDEIDIINDGEYYCYCDISFSGDANRTYEFVFTVNKEATHVKGSQYKGGKKERLLNIAFNGCLNFKAGDKIVLCVRTDFAVPAEITIKQGHFGLHRI